MISHDQMVSPFAGTDIADWLRQLAARRGEHPLLIFVPPEGAPRRWSYASFTDAVARVAGGLARRGVRPGDRVMVHLENCPEMLISRFACAWLGAVCVGTNAQAAGPELAWFADSTGAVGTITHPKFADAVGAHCASLKWIVTTSDDAGTQPSARSARGDSFDSLFADPLHGRTPDPYAAASIMFTTGTTSRPKGAVWTHANVLWGARINAMQQGLRADDISQVFLPLYHVVGLSWCTHSAMWAGGSIVLQPRFSASRYWSVAREYGATVGSHVFFTLNALASGDVPDHAFRTWIVARNDQRLIDRFRVGFVAGWGMTEVLTQAIVCEHGTQAPDGVIGRPSSGYRIRIVDDAGRQVARGGSGHLLVGAVRGLSIFREYDGDAKATAEAFDEHGFFRTGDRVILREDGWLKFGDRIKDVLKVGGEGVSASEIEAVVMRTPGVKEAAVVARPDGDYGEVPVAFVVLKPDVTPDVARAVPDAAMAQCREALAKFKVPRAVIILPEMPLVGFGKIAKVKLRELAAQP